MSGSPRPNQGSQNVVESDLTRLYTDEWVPMVRMATLVIGSAAVAEEVVQDAFSELSQRWESLDRPGAYLRRSVLNGCAMTLRRRAVESRYCELDIGPLTTEIPTRLLELQDALSRLSERQRAVVVLRYFVDISDGDIAEALDVRPATVRSLARRAFAVLRKELK